MQKLVDNKKIYRTTDNAIVLFCYENHHCHIIIVHEKNKTCWFETTKRTGSRSAKIIEKITHFFNYNGDINLIFDGNQYTISKTNINGARELKTNSKNAFKHLRIENENTSAENSSSSSENRISSDSTSEDENYGNMM